VSEPLISIYMPIYNGEKYVAETLRSLQAQTFTNFEVLVINDASTDGTMRIVEQFCSDDDRFRFVALDNNIGPVAARNVGWKLCNQHSKYLMNHDCDDISLPVKLERLKSYLDEHDMIGGVGCFVDYLDSEGNITGGPMLHWHYRKIRRTFGRLNSMINSATLIRRKMLEDISPFNTEYSSCDDYDFWVRALLAGYELANIPEVLHRVRVHSGSFGYMKMEENRSHVKIISTYYRKKSRKQFWNKLFS
jgi:glycosyltransferase involved in cell wall biosynthesis